MTSVDASASDLLLLLLLQLLLLPVLECDRCGSRIMTDDARIMTDDVRWQSISVLQTESTFSAGG